MGSATSSFPKRPEVDEECEANVELTMFANLDSAVECAPDQDLELVEGSKRGDVGAFEKIVRRYDRKLLRIAQNVTQNFEEAQEVVQIAFLKAFQSLDR